MPTAQRYGQRKVDLNPMPGARRSAAETAISEGAGVALAKADTARAAAGLFGDVARVTGNAAISIAQEAKQRADDTAFLEATNQFTSKLNDWQYNPETGAYGKKGKDAMDLPTDFEDTFTKTASDVAANLKTPEQRATFNKWLMQQHQTLDVSVKRHVSAQMDAYEEGEARAAVANAQMAIVTNYQDPREIGRQLAFGESVIRIQAKNKGAGAEATQQAIDAFRSGAHEQVVNRFLANDDVAKAKAYFDAMKEDGQIKGEALERIEKAMSEGVVREKTQDALGTLLNDPSLDTLEKQRAEARKRYSGELEDRVLQGLEHEQALKDEKKRTDTQQLMVTAKNLLEANNGKITAIPPAEWAKLTPSEAASLREYGKMLTKKEAVETDFRTQYSLKLLAASDPNKFRTVNLLGYVDKLSPSDLDELTNMQGAIIRGDAKEVKKLDGFMTQKQVVDDTMVSYNLNPNAKPDSDDGRAVAMVRELLDRSVQYKQQELKRELNNDEIRGELKNILATNVEVKATLWGTKTKPLAQLKIGDVGSRRPILEQALQGAGQGVDDQSVTTFDARVRLKLGDTLDGSAITRIPKDQVRDIAQALQSTGQTASPDNILKWYLRLLAVGAVR